MEKLALLGGTPARATLLPYAHQTLDADDLAAVTDALGSEGCASTPRAPASGSCGRR